MTFQFANMQEFMAMKGHGPYVWSAYGITLLGLFLLMAYIFVARKNFMKTQRSILEREQTQSASEQSTHPHPRQSDSE